MPEILLNLSLKCVVKHNLFSEDLPPILKSLIQKKRNKRLFMKILINNTNIRKFLLFNKEK